MPLLLLARMIVMMRICVNWKNVILANIQYNKISENCGIRFISQKTHQFQPQPWELREANRSMGEFFPSFLEERIIIKSSLSTQSHKSQTKTWGHLLLEVKTMTVLFLKTIVSVMCAVWMVCQVDAWLWCRANLYFDNHGNFYAFSFFPVGWHQFVFKYRRLLLW